MEFCVTGRQMKQIDMDAIGNVGIPSMVLMERAALGVVEVVEELIGRLCLNGRRVARIWIACGTGNNGADGIAAGRMLHQKGYIVTVLLAGDFGEASEEHGCQVHIARNMEVPLVEYSDFIPGSCDVIVDALLGIGLTRPVDGEYNGLIEMLREQKKPVVAVDIPSGIHGDTGAVLGTALAADVTVTFGWKKTGLLLYPGKEYAGEIRTIDIGFPKESLERVGWDAILLEPADLRQLPKRPMDSNKGTYGKMLVIAGSKGMSGAAYLCALAAYRTGVGLVKILTVEENRIILQGQLPEAIIESYEAEEIWENQAVWKERLGQYCNEATSIVLGPGLGIFPHVEALVETVLTSAYVPIVLDADALNVVAMNEHLTGYFTENIIITPHVGEMSRLTGMGVAQIKAQAVQTAREYSSRYGIVCVLKDAVTITADKDGDTYINTSGNSGMAKAGSGDVLAGIIGALLAQGMELKEAAALGVYLHGAAGDVAVGQLGRRSILAHELADAISQTGKEDL